MNIREMLLSDVREVVIIHLRTFPGFFLSFLGAPFLRELYTSILSDPSGFAYVYVEQVRVLGFVAGTDQPVGFYKRLIRRRLLRFLWASILPALRSPAIVMRLVRALDMPRQAECGDRCGTLMSIAVAPEAQGRGIGRQLVKIFLDESARRGLLEVNLVTDRLGNEATNRFYQQYGFHLARNYITPEGREMNEYRFNVTESN